MIQNTKTTSQSTMNMKTKMSSIKKSIFVFLIIDTFLIIFSLYMGGVWLINTQGGFISSITVILCSFYGYKKEIERKVKNFDGTIDDDRELIDKTLDPYGLWEDEEKPKKTKLESIKTSLENTKSFSFGFFSLYRIFGYVILVALCFFLVKKNIFNPVAFLVGLSSTTILILIYAALGLKSKK